MNAIEEALTFLVLFPAIVVLVFVLTTKGWLW